MQYTLSINQTKALEWGLNAQQAVLFSLVYECPSWCKPVTKGDVVFYALSKQKIIDELPLLTDKTDTAYRLLKQLSAKGVIEVSHTNSITLVRLTDIGKSWNHDHTGSEKFPSKGRKNIRSKVGKKSDPGRKILRQIKIPVIQLMLAHPAARRFLITRLAKQQNVNTTKRFLGMRTQGQPFRPT